ncbi:MAG: hypothetical protein AAF616_14675 [Bacteroidota bacterium]
MSHFLKWFLLGGLGLALTGAGLCFAIEAAFIKHQEGAGNEWIWLGTGALIVFNSGISIVGHAGQYRMRHWLEQRNSSGQK